MDDLEIKNVEILMNPSKSGELAAMLGGFKLSLNNYLKELIVSPVRSLADVIAFNENYPNLVSLFLSSNKSVSSKRV